MTREAVTTIFAPLSEIELDALFDKLATGSRRMERHTYYVYKHVPEDYSPALETWREINDVERDVVRENSREDRW